MTDKKDVLQLARERFERAYSFDEDNRREMKEDLEFKVGRQWDPKIVRERDLAGRPTLTINRMKQFIRQVTGDIRLNSPSIKATPTEDSDKEIARIFTGLIRNIEQKSKAKVAYVTAADGAASCGIGHFRITTEYSGDDVFDQDIFIKRIADPLSVSWDPDSTELTRSDAKYCFVDQFITVAEFKVQYPKAVLTDFEGTNEDLKNWTDQDGKIRLAEYWCKESVERKLGRLDNGEVVFLDDDEEQARIEEQGLSVVQEREVNTHKVQFYLLNGAEILEGPVEFPSKHIPIFSVIGEETHIGDEVVRSGIIRDAKDPQRAYNFWRSATTEVISMVPKTPFVGTAKQFKGHEDEWDDANTANQSRLTYTSDPAAPPPQRQPPAPMPVAMFQETAVTADDMKAVTGIYDSSLGASSAEKSGKAILARERQGDVGTYVYMDNLAMTMEYAGVVLVDLIPKIYDAQRTIRILGEDEAEEFVTINQLGPDDKITNDLTVGKYDVTVKTGPSFSTQRQEARESLMQFMQANPQAAPFIADLVAGNMDWPGAEEIAERLKKLLPEGMIEPDPDAPPPPPDPQAEQAMQAQQQAMQIEQKKLEAEQTKAELDIQKQGLEVQKIEMETVAIERRAQAEEDTALINRDIKLVELKIKEKELMTPAD